MRRKKKKLKNDLKFAYKLINKLRIIIKEREQSVKNKFEN